MSERGIWMHLMDTQAPAERDPTDPPGSSAPSSAPRRLLTLASSLHSESSSLSFPSSLPSPSSLFELSLRDYISKELIDKSPRFGLGGCENGVQTVLPLSA